MLHFHVCLHMVLVHDMLSLVVDHSALRMLSVHHGHVVGMADLRRIALLLTDGVRVVRRRRVLLTMLSRCLTGSRLVVHGDADMSLVIRAVGRGVRRWRAIAGHGH